MDHQPNCKIIKLLGGKIENLWDTELGKKLSDVTPKAESTEEKLTHQAISVRRLLCERPACGEDKRLVTVREKIPANHVSDTNCSPKHVKIPQNLAEKKQAIHYSLGTDTTRHTSEEGVPIPLCFREHSQLTLYQVRSEMRNERPGQTSRASGCVVCLRGPSPNGHDHSP